MGNGIKKPDPERFCPLQELLPLKHSGFLRTLGMFAYYAKWIQDFSDKIQPLAAAKKFSLDDKALDASNLLRKGA